MRLASILRPGGPWHRHHRTPQLANANEALRGCLDALASVPELDEFLGHVMAAMTRQLGAASSVLRRRSYQQNCLTLDLVFQDGRVMTPAEAKYPEKLQSVPLGERQLGMLRQPYGHAPARRYDSDSCRSPVLVVDDHQRQSPSPST
jgi:hypothetical protein